MAHRTSPKMVLRFLTLILYCLCGQLALAQMTSPILDQNPFSVRHKQIKLHHFPVQVIYPEGLDSMAQITASQLDAKLALVGQGIGAPLHPWKVVLQNQGMVSNGFVTLSAPRAEYFMMQPQDASLIGTNEWVDLLVSHESRHMFQNEMGRLGYSKLMHLLWGNYGQMAYTNLMIPNWIWEGDAVETETRINGFGRSVIPQFQMPLRAYLDMYGAPVYAKLMGRSYREFVPNHYVFGQFLVHQLQQNYGQEIVGKIWQQTLNRPGIFSFSRSVKNITGKSIDDFARESLQAKSEMRQKAKPAGFTNYLFPNPLDDSTCIVLKSGFDANAQLILRTPNKEKRLTFLGPYFDNSMLASSANFVIWSEYAYNARWGQKNQAVFYLYDLNKQNRIKWKLMGHATNPSISADSKYIGALVYKPSGASNLQVYERLSTKIVATLAVKPGEQILQPRLQGESDFVFIRKSSQVKTIIIWNWKDNKIRDSIQLGAINASHPYLMGEYIYVNLPVKGVDQVIRVSLKTKKMQVITQEKYGAYNGIPRNGQLVYSAYTAAGYVIAEREIQEKDIIDGLIQGPSKVAAPINTYTPTTYSKWNMINPFAWGPVVNALGNSVDLGIVSKDVLNNFQVNVGYQWNGNERVTNTFARLSYQGFFPVFDFSFESGGRTTELNLPSLANQFALSSDKWHQTKYAFGFRIPLNLTHSVFQESLEFGSKIDLLQVSGYDLTRRYISEAFNGTYTSMNYHLVYSKMFNRTYRDLQSKWGFQLLGRFTSTPFKQSLQSELWSVQSKVYLPGFLKHHGMGVRVGYQQESKGNYRFASSLYFPRGFSYAAFDQMLSYSLDYRFPVLSADLNLGRIAYLKRINVDLFADGGRGRVRQKSQTYTRDYRSVGVDLTFQMHLMRFSQEFELGVRSVYLPQTKELAWYPLVLDIGF